MNLLLEKLHSTLAALELTAADACLAAHLERAGKEEPSYAQFLGDLLEAEITARQDRILSTRLRVAHLPYQKTLEEFDFAFQPSIDRRQIRELETLRDHLKDNGGLTLADRRVLKQLQQAAR